MRLVNQARSNVIEYQKNKQNEYIKEVFAAIQRLSSKGIREFETLAIRGFCSYSWVDDDFFYSIPKIFQKEGFDVKVGYAATTGQLCWIIYW